jgi:methyl acetate hydrolase
MPAMKHILLIPALVVAVACGSRAEQRPSELDTLLRTAVEQRRVPHVVAMVATKQGVAYEHAVGVDADVIFSIASMTKPITSVAVMQLVEAGKVKLDEPAATYLPELSSVQVMDAGTMRPPRTPLTVRHLMTHTAGFGYEFMNRNLFDLVGKKSLPSMMAGGDAFMKAPLLFDPGTRWEYGISTDWLGRLVERVSGQSLEVYFRQHIFDPLGMPDSFFVVPPDKQPRVAKTYQHGEGGALTEPPPRPSPPAGAFYSGGGGLYSTARDYLTFTRALMSGGQVGERRILTSESVAVMGRNQIGDLTIRPFASVIPQLATDGAALPGNLDKFGLGFALNTKPVPTGRGANTLAWAGIFNTFFWIDRENQVSAVLMTQMLPGMDPGPAKLLEDFDRAVYTWTKAR